MRGSIRNVLLCVKEILVTGNLGHKTSVVNIVYYGLKSCIFVGLRDLWITGRNTLNTGKNIFKKTYIMETIFYF